jgi:hypothetical protein
MRLGHENQEFASRKMLFEARWPNAGKSVPEGLLEFNTAAMDTGTTPTKIVDDALPQVDFAGAHVWVSTFKRWYCWAGAVSAKAEGAIEIEDNSDSKENHICKPGGDYGVPEERPDIPRSKAMERAYTRYESPPAGGNELFTKFHHTPLDSEICYPRPRTTTISSTAHGVGRWVGGFVTGFLRKPSVP